MKQACPYCGVDTQVVRDVENAPDVLRLDMHPAYGGEGRYVFVDEAVNMEEVRPVRADASVAAYPTHDCERSQPR